MTLNLNSLKMTDLRELKIKGLQKIDMVTLPVFTASTNLKVLVSFVGVFFKCAYVTK